MKKSLLALAALTAFAGAASAQSSVTLFGIIDVAATQIKNGNASVKSLSADGNATSRLGFRGVEDLGGGMRAGFWLEGAIAADAGCGNPTTGAPSPTGTGAALCQGQTWQRRSTVSLMGSFGEVRLGRDYTPTFWNITVFDPWSTAGVGNALNMRALQGLSGATTSVRASNTIGYFLPPLGGLYGQVQVAAGEGATGNKYVGGRLGYAAGPVNVAVAVGKTYRTGAMLDDVMTANLGASFNAGFLTVQGHFDRTEYQNADQDLAMVAVLVPLGSGTLKASYTRSSGSGNIGGAAIGNALDGDQIAIGYVYDLSKRTAVYVQGARIDNDGSGTNGAQFRVNTGVGNTNLPTVGGNSTGYQVGIRHSF